MTDSIHSQRDPIRLGIIGTGRIARRFVKEAEYVPTVDIAAVYNPHRGSAKRFVDEVYDGDEAVTSLPEAFEDISDFLNIVDAVYIASPHGTHVEYARQALEAEKHTLCEKPMAFSVRDAESLFALAGEKGVVLKEAIKTADAPGFRKIEEVIASGVIGDVVDVEAAFTRLTEPGGREYEDMDFGGAFTEFGTYPLLPILRFMGTDYREASFISIGADSGNVYARRTPSEVDGYTKAIFTYAHGTATAKTGLTAKSEGQLLITGTRGYILAPSPWWMTRAFTVVTEDAKLNKMYTTHYEAEFLGDGLRYEIEDFTERIKSDESIHKNEKSEAVCRAGIFGTFFGIE